MREAYSFSQGGESFVIRLNDERRKVVEEAEAKGKGANFYDFGFVSPEDILSYFCSSCKQTHEGEELRPEVYIRRSGKSTVENPTVESVSVLYRCADADCSEALRISVFSDSDRIPSEYIVSDETGLYVTPTEESVQGLLKRTLERAKKGNGGSLDRPDYEWDLTTARIWSNRIGYEIEPEFVNEVNREWRKAFLGSFERGLPELLSEIRSKSFSFSLHATENDYDHPYSDSGLSEDMTFLLETLPHIPFPSDSKIQKNIFSVLSVYHGMFEEESERLREEASEIQKKLGGLENSLERAKSEIEKYTRKTSLDPEEVKMALRASAWTFADEIDEEME